MAMPLPVLSMNEGERDQLRLIPEWLPYVGCQDTKMLKQCFVWTTDECEMSVSKTANSCLNQYKSEWMNPISGSLDYWREKISDCVIRDIKTKNKNRIVESILCQNKGVTR
jgi:hypothetical protein